MFYAHFVLAKKGPLARIWLAAHWDKKLTKAHVFETNIEKSVDGILQPKVKMALRTSGHLLLGVVRIYSRKAKYLLADCNEAFVKIKMAFRPGMVDLPEEHREAAVNAITLPEVFHDFDTTMPELNDVDIEAQFSLNQSRAEEITMREDYGNISLVNNDDGFGDMGFDSDAPDLMRHASGLEPSMEQGNLLFSEPALEPVLEKEPEPVPSTSGTQHHETPMEIDTTLKDDGFGGNLDQNIMAAGLYQGGLFDDGPMGEVPPVDASIPDPSTMPPPPGDSDDEMDNFGGPPSVGGHSTSDDSRPASALPMDMTPRPPSAAPSHKSLRPESVVPGTPAAPTPAPEEVPPIDQTTLLQNEDEGFALAPVDAAALRDMFYLGFNTKSKRKRKLIVDEVKNISGEEMKNQLSDTSDIVTTLDLAPPTKRLMHWKETGGVEKLFALPARVLPARALSRSYQRHLTLRAIGTEDFAMLGDADSLAIEQGGQEEVAQEPVVPPKRGRKRKVVEEPPKTPMHQEEFVPEEALGLAPPTPSEMPPPYPQPQTPLGQEHLVMPPPATPGYPGTPFAPSGAGPPTPFTPVPPPPPYQSTPAIEEMPQLAPEQVRSILQETGLTSAGPEDLLAGPAPCATPQHPGLEGHLPLEPLDLPAMENMGYDQNQMANMGYDGQPHQTPHAGMSERVHSPWGNDYDFPQSVGAADEQQADETDEQFEERVLNKRAYQIFLGVRRKLKDVEQITMSEVCHRNTKKQAAQKFYAMLVLKKFQVLELEQSGAYEEIFLLKGPKFENPVL